MVALEYTGQTLIRFDDHSYRWIEIRRFACHRHASDEEILAGLIGHARYRDDFLSPDPREVETVHGPYRAAEISPSSFERSDQNQAAAVVEEFCGLDKSPPRPDVRERIDRDVLLALQNYRCYRLKALPHAIHEYGSVLWEFRELVAINNGSVLLVVMAID